MTFRIGQKVRIVKAAIPERLGLVCRITSAPHPVVIADGGPGSWEGVIPRGTLVQRVDLQPLPGFNNVSYPVAWLEPIPDDTVSFDEELSCLLPRTIRDLCSAGTAERAKRKART